LSALQVCAITFLAQVFSQTTIYRLTSIPAMTSSLAGMEFEMSDLYNSVCNNMSGEQRRSTDIVIVNVDHCSGKQIAEVFGTIVSNYPAAVGLDVMFPKPSSGDGELIAVLKSCPNLVLARGLDEEKADPEWSLPAESYFYDDSFSRYGITELGTGAVKDIVRNFRPVFNVGDSTMYCFAAELARLKSPQAFDAMLSRLEDIDSLPITYPNIQFETLSAEELLEAGDSLRQTLNGKIVLVGNLYDGRDIHLTPIDVTMSGVSIQAYIAQTILDESYIRSASKLCNWLIAIITCIVFLTLNFISLYHFSHIGRILLRFLQIFCLIVFYIVGSAVYAIEHLYIDFVPALIMIALGFFAYDVWVGLVAMVKGTIDRIVNREQRREAKRKRKEAKKAARKARRQALKRNLRRFGGKVRQLCRKSAIRWKRFQRQRKEKVEIE